MTFQSTAQELFVIDPNSPASQLPAFDTHTLSEVNNHVGHLSPIEVSEPAEVEIVVEELPGAPPGSPEPVLEVSEDPSLHVEDKNEAKKEEDPKGA